MSEPQGNEDRFTIVAIVKTTDFSSRTSRSRDLPATLLSSTIPKRNRECPNNHGSLKVLSLCGSLY